MNIFIAGLSYSVNDTELKGLFAEYGEILSAKVITDRATGRSKGYGFVEIEDQEAAQRAINELNGVEFSGRTISVSEARPRTEQTHRGNSYNQRGGYNEDRY